MTTTTSQRSRTQRKPLAEVAHSTQEAAPRPRPRPMPASSAAGKASAAKNPKACECLTAAGTPCRMPACSTFDDPDRGTLRVCRIHVATLEADRVDEAVRIAPPRGRNAKMRTERIRALLAEGVSPASIYVRLTEREGLTLTIGDVLAVKDGMGRKIREHRAGDGARFGVRATDL
jgi:hypothetical protein